RRRTRPFCVVALRGWSRTPLLQAGARRHASLSQRWIDARVPVSVGIASAAGRADSDQKRIQAEADGPEIQPRVNQAGGQDLQETVQTRGATGRSPFEYRALVKDRAGGRLPLRRR